MADDVLSILHARHGEAGRIFDTQAFIDFWQFYKELKPFLETFAQTNDDPLIRKYVHLYAGEHLNRIEGLSRFGKTWYSFFIGRSQDPEIILLALRDINDNLGNLVYQIGIAFDGAN